MNNRIFLHYGNIITFANKADMNNKITSIDLTVNNLSSNQDTERYYILKFIPALIQNNILSSPIRIECTDLGKLNNLPDFLIKSNNKEFVIEATMATTPQLMKQLKELRKKELENPDLQFEYNIRIVNDEIEIDLIEVKDNKLMGRPIFGDMPSDVFARLVSRAIINKTKKVPNYNIQEKLQKELLIYYQFPSMGGIDIGKALMYLYQYLDSYNYDNFNLKFDKVHVLRDRNLIYDILSDQFQLIDIS